MIYRMSISFPWVSISYHVTLTLEYELFLKTLILLITSDERVLELSYCTLPFLMTKSFYWFHDIWSWLSLKLAIIGGITNLVLCENLALSSEWGNLGWQISATAPRNNRMFDPIKDDEKLSKEFENTFSLVVD